MKLEYTYDDNNINRKIFIMVGLAFGLPTTITLLIGLMPLNIFIKSVGGILLIYFLIYLLLNKANERKRNKNKLLINEGNKLQGYIINAYKKYTPSGNPDTRYFCIIRVLVNAKEYDVLNLKNNEAFNKLIEILKYNNRIPVDVYEKNGDMCTDLNSIKLN